MSPQADAAERQINKRLAGARSGAALRAVMHEVAPDVAALRALSEDAYARVRAYAARRLAELRSAEGRAAGRQRPWRGAA